MKKEINKGCEGLEVRNYANNINEGNKSTSDKNKMYSPQQSSNYNGNKINRVLEAREQVYNEFARINGKLSRSARKSKYNNK